MHIVAINQFYAPHQSATAQLLTELAEGLVRRGHQVTAVASGDMYGRDFRGGVTIERVRATRLGKRSMLHRATDYASFYAGCAATLLRLRGSRPPIDAYLVLTTPPLIAAAPQLISLGSPTPVVTLVQDLYPDVAVALGAVKHNSIVHRVWEGATRLSLAHSARVVALSEAMARHLVAYGVEHDRIDVIPNWALAELEAPPRPTLGGRARLEYGLGDRFVVMYSGNLGAGHTFDTVLAAARRLRARADIVFAFVGEGMRRAEVERAVRNERLDNVKLLPLAPRENLAESLAAGDLHLVTMRDGLDGLIVPSKFYGVLAAARPTLFIGPRGDGIATTLSDVKCGMAHDNGDVDGVVETIESLVSDRDKARRMGELGRKHLETRLSRETAIDSYERTLVRAARGRCPTRQPQGREATA